MIARTERWHAVWVLRLLLDRSAAPDGTRGVDWDVLLDLARGNGVLMRTAERLAELGVRVPSGFLEGVARERERIRSTLDLVRHVSQACEACGIAFLFPKAFQDFPDFGDDVDLLVLERSAQVDRGIIAGLEAVTLTRDMGERMAGAVTYAITGCPSPLDVQHGRLGVVGEHTAFPLVLMRHRRHVAIEGTAFSVAAPADQLVLQGLQRISGRTRIALSDVVFTTSVILDGALDWDYVVAAAREHGAFAGLCCYLSYVDQIFHDVFGQELIAGPPRRALKLRGWGRVAFRQGAYRFPTVWANSRLYMQQLRARLAAGDWAGSGRLCLMPLVGAARLARRLGLGPLAVPEPPQNGGTHADHRGGAG